MERPNVARMYDYFLGGSHNFAVDRAAADEAIRSFPSAAAGARTNRSFLRRAVRTLAEAGVDQFLDLGSGIPTVGNVHEIARTVNPAARVVYVDIEPVAVAQSRAILLDIPHTAVVAADLRRPDQVLGHPDLRALLDPSRPVAVLMVAVLHFVPDSQNPAAVVAGYRDAVAPGSYLVVSHGSLEGLPEPERTDLRRAMAVYDRTPNPVVLRSRQRIGELLTGIDLLEPGLVQLRRWRPTSAPDENGECDGGFCAVGRVVRG
ncbi:MAG TPA: SAM-dependent methyltransferase [Mycobacteriales bacterium]|nr:SAM-dependent methyltransferase [Mycobacteriales bacterium]